VQKDGVCVCEVDDMKFNDGTQKCECQNGFLEKIGWNEEGVTSCECPGELDN